VLEDVNKHFGELHALKDIDNEELARAGRQIYVVYNNPLAVGLLIAAIYVIVNASLSRLAVLVERRTATG
jgi:ABC-type amino acid transport system permease subunit